MSDDELPEKEKKDGLLGEALKKVFTAGVSAAFMTEESVRAYLADLKLPKEILGVLLQQAGKTKEEIGQRVSKEIVSMIQKADISAEISKFASNHKFKFTAEFEIEKKKKE